MRIRSKSTIGDVPPMKRKRKQPFIRVGTFIEKKTNNRKRNIKIGYVIKVNGKQLHCFPCYPDDKGQYVPDTSKTFRAYAGAVDAFYGIASDIGIDTSLISPAEYVSLEDANTSNTANADDDVNAVGAYYANEMRILGITTLRQGKGKLLLEYLQKEFSSRHP